MNTTLATHLTHIDDQLQFVSEKIQRRVNFLTDHERLLMKARPRLLRLAGLRGVAPDAIEDVVQETLLEAWKHLDRLTSPEGFFAWIDEICRNVCRRYARKQQTEQSRFAPLLDAQQTHEDAGMAHDTIYDIPDVHTLDPLEELDRQDMAVFVDRALGVLPVQARKAVELHYLYELPQREVAERLGMTTGAVEVRLHRARRQLRQVLNGPLRDEAVLFGLAVDQKDEAGWQETRLWCTLCGQKRLLGSWQATASYCVGGHIKTFRLICPDCSAQFGTSAVSNKMQVPLDDVRTFRPAWKRLMQETVNRFQEGIRSRWFSCIKCGDMTPMRIIDRHQEGIVHHAPYRFWAGWFCPRCEDERSADGKPHLGCSVDDIVYWSNPTTRKFIMDHQRWISKLDQAIDYQGTPAILLQMQDMTSSDALTIVADRSTLEVLSIR